MSDQNNSSNSITNSATDPYDFERSAAEYYRQQAAFLDTVNKAYGGAVGAQLLLMVVPGPAAHSSASPWISSQAQHLASAILEGSNQLNDIQGLSGSINTLGYDPQVVRQAAQHYLDNAKTLEAKFEQLPASFDREDYIKLIEIQQMQAHAEAVNTRIQQNNNHKLATQQNQHSATKQKLWYSAAPTEVRQAA